MKSQVDINEKREQILKLCQEMLAANPRYRPMPPYMLVMILTRGGQVGRIILPDQDKRFSGEALVIDTYRPYMKYYDYDTNKASTKNEDSIPVKKPYLRECPVKPGDRIVFPYWAGVPTNIDQGMGDFRLLDERNAQLALEVPSDSQKEIQDRVFRQVEKLLGVAGQNHNGPKDIREYLEETFILIPRDARPVLEPTHIAKT